MTLPKISIITPTYNHAEYLGETIDSVLGQRYPELEYIIMDGGSTDGTADLVRSYGSAITHWSSAPDNGMYDALNRGMALATGDIRGWLNSDDFYFPGTLHYVSQQLDVSKPCLLFGNAFHFVQGKAENWGSHVGADAARTDLARYDYVIQPSAFWTRAAWELAGPLDESYQFSGDWEWFVRAQRAGVTFTPTERYLSAYRILPTSKTASGRQARWQEQIRLLKQYAGDDYAATYAQVASQRDAILRLRAVVRRWHLVRLEGTIFRAAFPAIFRKYPPREIWDMIETIGYN